MSGIEIIGIAASVLQLADLGGKLSVKLFTFSRKIKNADKSIASISAEIAQTGSILKQLGNELQKDDQLRLCSAEAVNTAKSLVDECYKVFHELNDALDSKSPSNKLVAAWKQKVKFAFIEPQVDLLTSNLERLKSSLLVMLNVLIFAEQLRNQEALPILKDQRELVRTLVEDKNASEAKLQRVLKAIEDLKVSDAAPPYSASISSAFVPPVAASSTALSSAVKETERPRAEPNQDLQQLPPALKAREEEIRHQCALLRNVIDEIGFRRYKIDHGLRDRMHRGVLRAHWDGWCSLRNLYGDEVLLRAFSDVPAVVSDIHRS
jgi:Fungal N-terminal domain of STAND proteins